MNRVMDRIRDNKASLLVGFFRILLYLFLLIAFFFFMSINNPFLLHINRTMATTLLIYIVLSVMTHAIYGGYDVGRRKSKPVISSMIGAAVLTDAVTFVQVHIMNMHDEGTWFSTILPDLLWLTACIAVQSLMIILMVRLGNTLYFHFTPPRKCLLILGSPSAHDALHSKIGRYKLQWKITDTVLYNVPDLEEQIRNADVVFLDRLPATAEPVILNFCYRYGRDVLCLAQLSDIMLSNARTAIVDDALFLEMDHSRATFNQRLLKRSGDIILSGLAIVITLPLMLLIAAAILTEDGHNPIFTQERLTLDGRTFRIRKFRTMTPDASVAPVQSSITTDDPRITKVGKLLRHWRLDELPQFFNIFIGEMSLVGPRPEMLSNIRQYKEELPDFVYRERMKAGLTGYAQIEGRYNTTPDDKLMMDLQYIESFSVWLDIKLILRTFTVFTKKDSTQGFSGRQR